MKNKKYKELQESIDRITPEEDLPSIEEQQAFVDNMIIRLRKDRIELEEWMTNFKKLHGLTDETF